MSTAPAHSVGIAGRRGVYVAVVKDGRGVATGSTGTSPKSLPPAQDRLPPQFVTGAGTNQYEWPQDGDAL